MSMERTEVRLALKRSFYSKFRKNIAKINISYGHDSALADLPLVHF